MTLRDPMERDPDAARWDALADYFDPSGAPQIVTIAGRDPVSAAIERLRRHEAEEEPEPEMELEDA